MRLPFVPHKTRLAFQPDSSGACHLNVLSFGYDCNGPISYLALSLESVLDLDKDVPDTSKPVLSNSVANRLLVQSPILRGPYRLAEALARQLQGPLASDLPGVFVVCILDGPAKPFARIHFNDTGGSACRNGYGQPSKMVLRVLITGADHSALS
jgi:hypothetical protein